MCELHGYAPGRGVHYLDGTLFEPGFALEGVAGYPIATDRYIRDTGDDRVVDEPALADTLYLVADDLDARRDKRVPLYSTEVSPSGDPAPHPVHVARATPRPRRRSTCLRRTLDEETARGARRIPTPCARRSIATSSSSADGQVDVRVGDRSRRRDVGGRRSVGVGVLACRSTRRCRGKTRRIAAR